MADIEKAFTHLHDNIPQWLKSITEIEDKVAKMQSEMAKVPLSRTPLKRKTGSVESIRDLDAVLDKQSPSSSAAPTNLFAGQKRKTPSITSGHASGPSKYRTRNMIIVHYDGQIQKQFELLVRNIGTGRNLLRKGKMAAKLEALAELAGSDDSSEGDEDASNVMSKLGYQHRTGLSSMRSRTMRRGLNADADSVVTPVEVFESTDKALELAQGLCERAAHQSLRDGDCRKEMDSVRIHFQEVLETATREMKRCIAHREKQEAKAAAQQAAQKEAAVEEVSAPELTHVKAEPKSVYPTTRAPPVLPPTSTTLAIEIDDDEDDDMDFVMPPIRLTSRA